MKKQEGPPDGHADSGFESPASARRTSTESQEIPVGPPTRSRSPPPRFRRGGASNRIPIGRPSSDLDAWINTKRSEAEEATHALAGRGASVVARAINAQQFDLSNAALDRVVGTFQRVLLDNLAFGPEEPPVPEGVLNSTAAERNHLPSLSPTPVPGRVSEEEVRNADF
jgi:hypothetical protein